jgi:sterol desaturase/sphingolipid hydroxylase (fatty acid hydroxylase superfamily)
MERSHNLVCDYAFASFPQNVIFAVIVYVGFWFFDYILVPLSALAIGNRILPDKARRNVVLNFKDNAFVQFNRLVTVLFLYHMTSLACSPSLYSMDNTIFTSGNSWQQSLRVVLQSVAVFTFLFFPVVIVVYDFFYSIFHRVLHIEWIYPLIHKHHHMQYTPWRGNVDAINTHPIEYVLGEYNHLWSLFIVGNMCNKFFGYKPHALFVLVYIVVAGLLSTLNHTRVDVRIPYLYNVWWHDLHHRVPPSNYGQYTMLWDYVFGWYKEETTKSLVDDGEVANNNNNINKNARTSTAVVATRPSGVPRTTTSKTSAPAKVVASPSPKKATRTSSKKSTTSRASSGASKSPQQRASSSAKKKK